MGDTGALQEFRQVCSELEELRRQVLPCLRQLSDRAVCSARSLRPAPDEAHAVGTPVWVIQVLERGRFLVVTTTGIRSATTPFRSSETGQACSPAKPARVSRGKGLAILIAVGAPCRIRIRTITLLTCRCDFLRKDIGSPWSHQSVTRPRRGDISESRRKSESYWRWSAASAMQFVPLVA